MSSFDRVLTYPEQLKNVVRDIDSLSASIQSINIKLSKIVERQHKIEVSIQKFDNKDLYAKFDYLLKIINSIDLDSFKGSISDLKIKYEKIIDNITGLVNSVNRLENEVF